MPYRNKEDQREHDRQYRKENKEKIAIRDRQYYQKNKEKKAINGKRWREENKEYAKERSKKYNKGHPKEIKEQKQWYREKNKIKIKKYRRKYRRAHKEENLILVHRRRARKKKLSHTLTIKQWNKTLSYFNYKCAYCGKPKKLHQEHVVPLSKGGGYTKENIIPACQSCNLSKQGADMHAWYSQQSFYSPFLEKRILNYLGYNKTDKTQQLKLGAL